MSKSKESSKEEKVAKNIKFVQLSIGSIKRLPVTQSRSPEAEKFLFFHCLLDGEQFNIIRVLYGRRNFMQIFFGKSSEQ